MPGPPAVGPAWTVGRAVRQGGDHRARGLPCQDVVGLRRRPDGGLLAALADGAGSAEDAGRGAAIAVAAAIDHLDRALDATAAAAADDALESLGLGALAAAAAALDGRHQACTLILCAALPHRLLAAQVGDGFLVVGDGAPDHDHDHDHDPPVYRRALPGWRGEHVNETVFLTDADWRAWARVAVVAPPGFLCLSSDGLEHLAIRRDGDHPHTGFFRPLDRFLGQEPADPDAALAAFLAAPETAARSADDLSLIVAVRR
jgi:serine/threonine protein phosphatase PrpC